MSTEEILPDRMEDRIYVIITTIGNQLQARELSRALVSQRYAACVQLSAIESIYRWQGEVEEEEEIRLMIKVAEDRRDDVISYLQKHHPYDTPEIIMSKFSSSSAYASWCQDVSA